MPRQQETVGQKLQAFQDIRCSTTLEISRYRRDYVQIDGTSTEKLRIHLPGSAHYDEESILGNAHDTKKREADNRIQWSVQTQYDNASTRQSSFEQRGHLLFTS
ncbi:hypothetical protein [Tunturiibacter gelidiferens]|uniref:hypothetical protein n=1 Tax=Tunturiibacter gelidiferens TaxID=3069689 RepID=UPI003D9AE560